MLPWHLKFLLLPSVHALFLAKTPKAFMRVCNKALETIQIETGLWGPPCSPVHTQPVLDNRRGLIKCWCSLTISPTAESQGQFPLGALMLPLLCQLDTEGCSCWFYMKPLKQAGKQTTISFSNCCLHRPVAKPQGSFYFIQAPLSWKLFSSLCCSKIKFSIQIN